MRASNGEADGRSSVFGAALALSVEWCSLARALGRGEYSPRTPSLFMAAWQATFELYPISNSPSSYRAHLDEHVPRISSWRPELEWWGAEDGNRIDVWSQRGTPEPSCGTVRHERARRGLHHRDHTLRRAVRPPFSRRERGRSARTTRRHICRARRIPREPIR